MFTSSDRSADGETIMRGAPGFEAEDQQPQYQDPLDDVFGSAPGSPAQDSNPGEQPAAALEFSDIPRLRSIHVTNGYREGISKGKESSIQAGFDEGYALGAEYGHLAAWIKGVLHALQAAAKDDATELDGLILEADKDLSLESLFSQTYFDENGIWMYTVPASDETATFRVVAAAHPLLLKWRAQAIEEASKMGLTIQ